MKLLLTLTALVAIGWTAIGAQTPLRVFRLQFQLADFVVPVGETWLLRWHSPYHSGDICPSYDVRVFNGGAGIGLRGELQARPFAPGAKTADPLDLSATKGEVTIWLQSGTRFSTANDLLEIEVHIFPKCPGRLNIEKVD